MLQRFRLVLDGCVPREGVVEAVCVELEGEGVAGAGVEVRQASSLAGWRQSHSETTRLRRQMCIELLCM